MPTCALAPLAFDAEPGERGNQPVFKCGDEGPDIATPTAKVEHHIGHALAGAVIGEAAAAARPIHWKAALIEQLARLGAGAGGVKGRVLEQPHAVACLPRGNRRDAGIHDGERVGVGDGRIALYPVDRTW